ncbi:class I adenylate cyclase [Pseudodesulfovibrio sediminis]|uniref:Adenylate cyclase class-I N-terminal domain-containing protein n=1 Tax=Pseudodesulfovibrio sediminis TaxID=2810563 RepID=A0ABN6ERT6_9BACT|nr:class I adenylate cyclase [Pseudodesulfovibrio sediminis]BCS87861.1 hypothetical protein PSDVSF_11030 [Pseudodesulfovibrio sediminis]
MGLPLANIRTIAARIREFPTRSVLNNTPTIDGLTLEFIDWCTQSTRVLRPDAAPFAEIVRSLHAIADRSSDIRTVQHCLHAMVHSGRFGRILSSRFITSKSVPLHKLDLAVSAWPAPDRLALAHEMLLNYPGNNDRETLIWLESLLQPLVASDPVELAPFVASLGERGEPLAFPVKQALTNGLFGKWVNTRIANGTSGQELQDLCRIINALGDAHYAEILAKSIETKRIIPNARVLRTIAAVGEAGNKTILTMLLKQLSNASNGLAGACLDAIIAQGHHQAGKLLASVRTKMPGLKQTAIARSPLLGDVGYAQYIRSLPEEDRMDAHLESLSILEFIAPDFTRNISRHDICKSNSSRSFKKTQPHAAAVEKQKATTPSQAGLLSRIFKNKPKTLEVLLPKFRNIRDMELPGSKVIEDDLDGRAFVNLNLTASLFSKTTFLRTKISTSTLTDTRFNDCVCTGTTFSGVDFSGSTFSNIQFTKCTFTDCTFTDATLADSSFDECRLRGCSFGDTAVHAVSMNMTEFTLSSLAGCAFHNCRLRTTRFTAIDFSFAEFVCTDFHGVEFLESVLHAIYIRGCTMQGVEFPKSTVTRSIVKNSDVSHPLLLANRIRQMTLFARDAEAGATPRTKQTDPFQAQKTLAMWSRELTFMRRERRMLDNNRTRLARAIQTMDRDQHIFLRILPLLLDTSIFEHRFGLEEIPSCRVWGYESCLTPLELARRYFDAPLHRDTSPDVRILAVYAMGSLGTVAQTPQSDIDCWVCYDGDLTINQEKGLRRKLEALGLWAESEFRLEAHFYPMRMDDVRDNRFLSGDEESSGSAQALLLKEEFYRTALKLAGKNIAWWIAPAGTSKKGYENCIHASRRYPMSGKPRLEDFGYLAPVPPDEYFGGSLWQIVKAMRAPFKSVLKLGLLETYAAPGASALSLCDRIKKNLVSNRRGKLDTDPYTALFSTLHTYYLRRKQTNTAALLKESFRLKANLSEIPFFMNLPTRAEDDSLISVLFGSGYVEPDRITGSNRAWPFEKSLMMGASVRQYMVDTYQRIQSGLSTKGATKAHINSEDLTRMGRRIGANFSKKKHKVMRVPFMDAKGSTFPILHFSTVKSTGKPTIWTVRGGSSIEAKQSAEAMQMLHRTHDPIHILSWLLANRIYHPKSLLQADRSIAPISVADLQKVMATLHDFFPFERTFERDINDGLKSERITRAFFILNLTSPHDINRIEEATVIYATNWGEMFCRSFQRPGQMLEANATQFLTQKLDQPITDAIALGLFIPRGSQCRRISLG